MTRVLAVTVCYRSLAALQRWYVTASDDDVQVVLVDNDGGEDLGVEAARLGAMVIGAGANLGFGRGCNLGATLPTDAEWVAFVNPDLAITSEQLVAVVDAAPADAVALCPRLTDPDGNPLPDVARMSPGWAQLALPWLIGARGDRGVRLDDSARHQPVEVTSGACLIVRRDAFEAVGGFPSWLFFNAEDVYLCDRLRERGRIYVDQGVTGVHEKLSSAKAVPMAAIMAETARATSAYAASSFGRVAWLAVFKAIVVGLVLRAAVRPDMRPLVLPVARLMWREARRVRRGELEPVGPVFI
jgi:N-acetylglucosaminyl-diphospho-decaprenol L-rhamnosyltransferase